LNSLPNSVVSEVCLFKARLGKLWMHQDIKCDFKFGFTADLTESAIDNYPK